MSTAGEMPMVLARNPHKDGMRGAMIDFLSMPSYPAHKAPAFILLGTNNILYPPKGTFEGDFPIPKVGSVP